MLRPIMMQDHKKILKEIPIIEVDKNWPLQTLEHFPEHAEILLDNAAKRFSNLTLKIGDFQSKRWLNKSNSPYIKDIENVHQNTNKPGAYLLNISYEWGCTCQAALDPKTQTPRLIRVLDWPDEGLGEYVIAAKIKNDFGNWTSLTWPGYAGVLQAVAKGRFAAAINQAPMDLPTGWIALDWLINRIRAWNTTHIPPAHLLRQVFETAKNYNEAKDMLSQTPITVPAIFVLTGLTADEACVIERKQEEAFILEGPVCAANSWRNTNWKGCFRGEDNTSRLNMMEQQQNLTCENFSWLKFPILNTRTRLAMITDATTGNIIAQGFEDCKEATKVLRI